MSTKDLSTYVPVFDGTNYKEWYDKLEAFAMAMKCNGPMTKDPPAGAADLAAFNIIDRQLQGMICLRLGATYQSHVGITAKCTWTTLKTTFGTPGRVGALVEMRSMFQHCMKPNSNPIHEANNLIQYAAQLSTARFALADGLIAMAILMVLPLDWEMTVLTLCSMLDDASFTVESITSHINHEYMHRQATRGRSTISLQDHISEQILSLLSIKDLTPLLCHVLPMLNPLSVPLIKGEVTEEKASNLFAKDNATSTRVVSFRDVAGITSQLSFVPLVDRESFMTKAVNRSAANHRSSLLLLEDRVTTIVEDLDLVVAKVENEDEERVKTEGEELMLLLMSPSNIMTSLIMKNFRIIRP